MLLPLTENGRKMASRAALAATAAAQQPQQQRQQQQGLRQKPDMARAGYAEVGGAGQEGPAAPAVTASAMVRLRRAADDTALQRVPFGLHLRLCLEPYLVGPLTHGTLRVSRQPWCIFGELVPFN